MQYSLQLSRLQQVLGTLCSQLVGVAHLLQKKPQFQMTVLSLRSTFRLLFPKTNRSESGDLTPSVRSATGKTHKAEKVPGLRLSTKFMNQAITAIWHFYWRPKMVFVRTTGDLEICLPSKMLPKPTLKILWLMYGRYKGRMGSNRQYVKDTNRRETSNEIHYRNYYSAVISGYTCIF